MAIDELDVRAAAQMQGGGALLIDVRERHEQALGRAAGALALPLSELPGAALRLAGPEQTCLLICASGNRSRRAAELLAGLGFQHLYNVSGGTLAWREAGLPLESGAASGLDRYLRHLSLPEVGIAGQLRLLASRVLIVGAGGLGSPAALYLAAAGVGRLRIVDDDRVELSNLQRQILHTDARIGMEKVASAKLSLAALNPETEIEALPLRIDAGNADALVADVDLVLDGADNLATRYVLDAACRRAGKPMVYGAVQGFSGQVSVFWQTGPGGPWPCYRCLFPEPPPPEAVPNCAELGVLGVVPGLIGCLQAAEALKLLLGIGQPLLGRLLLVDTLAASTRTLGLSVDPDCPGCGAIADGSLPDTSAACSL